MFHLVSSSCQPHSCILLRQDYIIITIFQSTTRSEAPVRPFFDTHHQKAVFAELSGATINHIWGVLLNSLRSKDSEEASGGRIELDDTSYCTRSVFNINNTRHIESDCVRFRFVFTACLFSPGSFPQIKLIAFMNLKWQNKWIILIRCNLIFIFFQFVPVYLIQAFLYSRSLTNDPSWGNLFSNAWGICHTQPTQADCRL